MPVDLTPWLQLQQMLGVMGPRDLPFGSPTGPQPVPYGNTSGGPVPGGQHPGGGQEFDWTQLLGAMQDTAPQSFPNPSPRLSTSQLGDYSGVIQQLTAPLAPRTATATTAPGPVAQAQAAMEQASSTAPQLAASSFNASNLAPSEPGKQETILDHIFRTGATGVGGQPIGQQLFNLSMGRLPPALSELLTAQTAEQMGAMGNRFGTDLATATSRGLAQASEAQSLAAMQQLLGLGGTTAGFQFARGENALDRALKEYLANQQFDMLNQLLPLLLGG